MSYTDGRLALGRSRGAAFWPRSRSTASKKEKDRVYQISEFVRARLVENVEGELITQGRRCRCRRTRVGPWVRGRAREGRRRGKGLSESPRTPHSWQTAQHTHAPPLSSAAASGDRIVRRATYSRLHGRAQAGSQRNCGAAHLRRCPYVCAFRPSPAASNARDAGHQRVRARVCVRARALTASPEWKLF